MPSFSIRLRTVWLAFACAGALPADIINQSFTDLWDYSRGTVVTANTPVNWNANAAIGRWGPGDQANNIFHDHPAGFVDYLEWTTVAPVTIGHFHFFATGDYPSNPSGHTLSYFRLLAWNGSAFDLVYEDAVTPWGGAGSHGYSDYDDFGYALLRDVTLDVPVTAQLWRGEFTHWATSGGRINELDGFGPGIPEPGSLGLLAAGCAALLAWKHRGRRAGC